MKEKKFKETVMRFLAMMEILKGLRFIGNMVFQIVVTKNYNILELKLKEFKFKEHWTPEYKQALKQIEQIKKNIARKDDSSLVKPKDDKEAEILLRKKNDELKTALIEFWNTGKNKKTKKEIDKVREEWTGMIKTTELEVDLYEFKVSDVPREYFEKLENKDQATAFIQIFEKLIT